MYLSVFNWSCLWAHPWLFGICIASRHYLIQKQICQTHLKNGLMISLTAIPLLPLFPLLCDSSHRRQIRTTKRWHKTTEKQIQLNLFFRFFSEYFFIPIHCILRENIVSANILGRRLANKKKKKTRRTSSPTTSYFMNMHKYVYTRTTTMWIWMFGCVQTAGDKRNVCI